MAGRGAGCSRRGLVDGKLAKFGENLRIWLSYYCALRKLRNVQNGPIRGQIARGVPRMAGLRDFVMTKK